MDKNKKRNTIQHDGTENAKEYPLWVLNNSGKARIEHKLIGKRNRTEACLVDPYGRFKLFCKYYRIVAIILHWQIIWNEQIITHFMPVRTCIDTSSIFSFNDILMWTKQFLSRFNDAEPSTEYKTTTKIKRVTRISQRCPLRF